MINNEFIAIPWGDGGVLGSLSHSLAGLCGDDVPFLYGAHSAPSGRRAVY
jgi:hypothetical protein